MPGEPADALPDPREPPAGRPSRFAGFASRTLVVLGLSGLAVAQPLLDLFGRNPEFFVAGSYDSAQIIVFALAITLVPPAVGIAIVALGTVIHPAVGRVAFGLVVGVLSTVLALALFRTLDLDRDALAFTAAAALGLLLTFLVLRTRGGRMLATYLSAANLVFLGVFVFASPTAALVANRVAPGDLGRIDVPAPPGPVVMVVLDELALTALLRGDGSLNADRFPNFARLAATSTWFRNASSPHQNTPAPCPRCSRAW